MVKSKIVKEYRECWGGYSYFKWVDFRKFLGLCEWSYGKVVSVGNV